MKPNIKYLALITITAMALNVRADDSQNIPPLVTGDHAEALYGALAVALRDAGIPQQPTPGISFVRGVVGCWASMDPQLGKPAYHCNVTLPPLPQPSPSTLQERTCGDYDAVDSCTSDPAPDSR